MKDQRFDDQDMQPQDVGADQGELDGGRRSFLLGIGKWSAVVVGLVLGTLGDTEDAEAGAWVNRRGGWANRGGSWANRRRRGGWVNRRGGGGWVNRRR